MCVLGQFEDEGLATGGGGTCIHAGDGFPGENYKITQTSQQAHQSVSKHLVKFQSQFAFAKQNSINTTNIAGHKTGL